MSADPQLFSDYFFRLTGHSPMRWQQRLFDQFIDGKIPAALDLPTGLGKTSVMAIWLAARALAGEDALKAIPRRLVYIVDRRAVVDQATAEAEKLRTALEADARHLKEQLRLDGTLPISTLRGAYADNREWLDDPAAPAIIVGTVDMIGSRLLFEGYGVSRKMRPFHAGLLGADTLVVLDEAHLVPPFEALLRRIEFGTNEFGSRANANDHHELVPPFRLLSLSATGRAQSTSHGSTEDGSFHLEGEDISDPVVIRRLAARKTLEFVKISDAKDGLADALTEQAWMALAKNDRPLRCLVYCDSREIAEKVKEKLDKLAAPDKKASQAKADTELFVGARRVKEREDAKTWLQSHGFLAGSGSPAKPAFLIATSAGEVGVDLDADHMVCDLVPWERMVQRLGRVNRRGESDATIAVIHGDEPKPKKPNEPTEQERRQIVGFRSRAVFEELPNAGDGKDASPGALRELKLRAETDEALRGKIAAATTPEPLRPALTRALVDSWSMTSLEHHTGRPDVAPWLRGWVEDNPQTAILWRKYLPVREGIAKWPRTPVEKREVADFFEAAPPHQSEKLETETYRVASWFQARANALLKRKRDAPKESTEGEDTGEAEASTAGAPDTDEPETEQTTPARELGRDDIVAFALSPGGDYGARYTLGGLAQERKGKSKDEFQDELVGKILVVDARFSGLKDGLLDAACGGFPDTADGSTEWSTQAQFRVRRPTSDDYESRAEDWRFEDEFVLRYEADGDPAERLVVEHFRDAAQSENGRSISQPQELHRHIGLVEKNVQRIAGNLSLTGIAIEVLTLAARLHDEGKRAMRWQRAFKAPRDAKKYNLSLPLGKTRGPIDLKGLDGYRHEFGSLAIFEPGNNWAQWFPEDVRKRFDALPAEWRDLILHLIAAHHGQARPVIETRSCEDTPPTALAARARDVALRFAQLQNRWGPWGLAWWESLLRAADQQASRDNDRREGLGAPQAEEK